MIEKLLSNLQIKLNVENDHLILHGSPTESVGCVLRGTMIIKLKEPTKIKSISLEFSGKCNTSWLEDINHLSYNSSAQEHLILSHVWPFLPKQSKSYMIPAGTYSYAFELALPGNLLESTYIPGFYTVQYQLKGTIERGKLLPNISEKARVLVSRLSSHASNSDLLEPSMVTNQWGDKLKFEITLPKRLYTYGDTIPVSAIVHFLDPTFHLRIESLTSYFKEHVYCCQQSYSRSHKRILCSFYHERFRPSRHTPGKWSLVQNVQLPSSPFELQCDNRNENICIRHRLKVILSVINKEGHTSKITVNLPITITASTQVVLPSYDEIGLTLPYNPASVMVNSMIPYDRSLPSYHSVVYGSLAYFH
ncbi:hypothetical protein EDC96DRAFT_514093 [Choanephora cucurbitarum]|nr:hypothetical protein EDC96DRAFT_514093 [Choanephora cucurbitarum]